MKQIRILLIMMATFVAVWCFAENFLVSPEVPKKQTRRQPTHKKRQEIVQLMGVLVEQISSTLETEAKIQVKLCKELRAYAEGKKNILTGKSSKELDRLLMVMLNEHTRLGKQQLLQKKFLASL